MITQTNSLPAIPKGDVKAKWDYYSSLVRANLGKIEDGVDNVIGLRGLAPDGSRHDSAENVGRYNDTMVILHNGADGQHSVVEFPCTTHAGNKTSPQSPEGVAQLRPGNYEAVPHHNFNDLPSWQLLTLKGDGHVPAWRDLNGDGYLSASEKTTAEKNGTTATGILIHNGKFADTRSSVGCQMLPAQNMPTFIADIGTTHPFHYTLIDANQPVRQDGKGRS